MDFVTKFLLPRYLAQVFALHWNKLFGFSFSFVDLALLRFCFRFSNVGAFWNSEMSKIENLIMVLDVFGYLFLAYIFNKN